jgi:signal transduction histidine kinase
MRLRSSSWQSALIGIVVIKAVLSVAVTPGSFLASYSGISYLLLLLLATGFAIRNAFQKTLGSRSFWAFLGSAYALWALNQGIQLYYELVRHIETPADSIADTLLFLHVVPLIAAVITLPNRNAPDRKLYRVLIDSLLVLFLWSFLYGYSVFPYQYLYSSSSYAMRFDVIYLLENLALVLGAGILTLRIEQPWKKIYLHLLGASGLYAISSAAANLAIDSGGYVNGKLYGLGLTASVCWSVWVPLQARQFARAELANRGSDVGDNSRSSAWAMIAVVMISIPIVWELLRRNENTGLRTLRILVAVATVVCLASAAYIKEYLARRELASRMEETLSTMSRKLIESQEQERIRIGRELHDDINQRLAMLSVELEQLQRNPVDVQARVIELQKRATEISNDVQALSHELHSAKLQYLGVVGGIKSWCKEFGERQTMEIEFSSDVSIALPPEVGLCLFRVLQEALHNAVKHSGVNRIGVQLAKHSHEVHLIITDAGRGFDLNAAREGRGLGLTNMQERVRLLNGTILVKSKPMSGTTIHVRVPLASDGFSKRAAG